MNAISTAFGWVFVLILLAMATSWLQRLSLFNLSAIVVQGDVVHNNAVTLRANVAPVNWPGGRAYVWGDVVAALRAAPMASEKPKREASTRGAVGSSLRRVSVG